MFARSVLGYFLLCAALACSDPEPGTWTVITIDADESVRTAAKTLHVRVESGGVLRLEPQISLASLPQDIVVSPLRGDSSRMFTVIASADDDADKTIARIELTSGFVAQATRYATIALTSGCEGASVVEFAPSELRAKKAGSDAVVDTCTRTSMQPPHGEAGRAGMNAGTGGQGGDGRMPRSGSGGGPPQAHGDGGAGGEAGHPSPDSGGKAAPPRGGAGGEAGAGGAAPSCQVGYEPTADGGCRDVDECQRTPGICGDHGHCENRDGTFICNCDAGFDGSGSKACIDRNECKTDNHGCEQRCVNDPGSAHCECDAGAYLRADQKTCWQWHSALKVENGDQGDAHDCSVAIDGNGNATALWLQPQGTQTALWSNRYVAGAWQSASVVDSDSARPIGFAAVALASYGERPVAVWMMTPGDLRSSVFDGGWQAPSTLRMGDLSPTLQPLVWHPNDGIMSMSRVVHQGSHFTSQVYTSGMWGTSQELPFGPGTGPPNIDAVDYALTSSSASLGVDAAVVWVQVDPMTGPALVAARFVSNAWESATPLRQAGGNFGAPKVSIGPYRGKTFALWSEYSDASGTKGTLVARNFDATAGWGVPTKVSDYADANGSLKLAADGDDNVVAVWQRADTKPASIWSMHFDAKTSAWSAPAQIDTPMSGDASAPLLALEREHGTALAVWAYQGKHREIWATRYSPDTGWGTAKQIAVNGTFDASTPCAAISPNSHALVLWQESDGTRLNLMASSLE